MASRQPIHEAPVREMVAAQWHRGPDAASVRSWGRAILGSNRLRVIDVRDVADQPLSNEDGTISVVFNGEIYNFRELRDRLQRLGHVFSTKTDTEVLVHLYEEHGSQLVQHLRGMFAFALWDERRGKLLAARDRLGIKPLYYVLQGETLSLASEARALAGNRPRKLNGEAVLGYLQFGWVPSPQTIFDGIKELPPGNLLEWSDGRVEFRKWWDPLDTRDAARRNHPGAENRAQPSELETAGGPDQRLVEALRDSVSRNVVADVPVGLFLSSGLDSVALAFLASKQDAEVATFTVAFDVGADESHEASKWAGRLGIPHRTIRVSGEEILESLPAFIANLDQPTVDGLNTWVVSQAVSGAGMKVALSGLGGDELFEGYSTFRRLPILHRFGELAGLAPQGLRSAVLRMLESSSEGRVLNRAVEAIIRGGWPSAYASMRGVMKSSQLERLAPGSGQGALDQLTFVAEEDALDTVLQLELRNYLPQQLLRDTDVTGMAHSLEVRVPLLDDAVFAAALESPVDADGRRGKARLAAAVDPSLIELASRPKKTFTLPINSWLKGPLRATSRQALGRLSDPDVGLERWELSLVWDRFEQGRVHWRTVWALTILGLWVDQQRP